MRLILQTAFEKKDLFESPRRTQTDFMRNKKENAEKFLATRDRSRVGRPT